MSLREDHWMRENESKTTEKRFTVFENMMRKVVACALLGLTFGACNVAEPDDATLRTDQRVQLYVNAPGSRPENEQDRYPSEILVSAIDRAQVTLDACVYGFSKQNVIDAVVRAHYRGVRVRVVGDARHFSYGERGYRAMQEHRIPMQVGNQFHIMHNKFFVIDDRFTFVGTGNITTTGFTKNDNNWMMIDSQQVSADFGDEFDQMFSGRFSSSKIEKENGKLYQVGDTQIELYFSPQEDAMGKILAELDAADTSVHFQIFAFTKDQVGSRFVRKHREFNKLNEQDGTLDLPVIDPHSKWAEWPPSDAGATERNRKVVGILDKSQLHGNGQYHEGYRLISNAVPMRIDANDNSYTPGDYQAGGGRLHTKTMILDYGTPNARVLTGSFNWSSAATIANDEVLLVLRGERIVNEYMKVWRELWNNARELPAGLCAANEKSDILIGDEGYVCGGEAKPGDVVISEVHWDGWNDETDNADHTGASRDRLTNDEFVELYNTTDRPIDISMWTLYNGHDATMGFTPGTVIQPGQYFLLLDHNLPPFSEVNPQRGTHAFKGADFVLNMANDPRFPRLNIKNSQFRLELRAPRDTTSANANFEPNIIDAVGSFSPPPAGGRRGDKNYSMERVFTNGQPTDEWRSCTASEGGENVNEDFRAIIIATPGEPNSVSN